MNFIPWNGWPQLKDLPEGLEHFRRVYARFAKVNRWYESIEETELTGNPVIFDSALKLNATAVDVELLPIQDLHGLPYPYVGGAYKNKLPLDNQNTVVHNYITYTKIKDAGNNDIGVNVNGTADGLSYCMLAGDGAATNSISGYTTAVYLTGASIKCEAMPTGISLNFRYTDGSYENSVQNRTIVLSKDVGLVFLQVDNGVTVDNVKVYPIICLSTETDMTFAPYSNICPISGRTAVVITQKDSDEQTTETLTIQLGQTVYGGTLDVKTGVGSITRAVITVPTAGTFANKNGSTANDMYYFNQSVFPDAKRPATNTDNLHIKCSGFSGDNSYEYIFNHDITGIASNSSGNFAIGFSKALNIDTLEKARTWLTNNPLQVCYELATPTTVQLTANELEMLKGYNYISIDADSLTVKAYTI